MSDNSTKRLIEAYYQEAEPTAFFSGMFQARAENFHNTEEVEIDIVRSEEDVAIVVQDMSTGYRMNSADFYTNKGFKPPVFMEGIPLNSEELLKRMPGQTTFDNPNFRANIIKKMFDGMKKVQRKIDRALELQSSQIMTSGVVDLQNASGTTLYTLDYKPKPTHLPTSGTTWASATLEQKNNDILSLCNVIRGDGLVTADQIIFGETDWENYIQTSGALDRFDALRANVGTISSMQRTGEGGIYRGVLEIGNYKLDVFTYDGRYKDPQTGSSTKYMPDGKVIVRASSARMDATFGAVPNIGRELGLQRNIPELMPSRMSSVASGMDMNPNVWLSDDGTQLFGGVASRPLMIPTAIDTYGCLTTQL